MSNRSLPLPDFVVKEFEKLWDEVTELYRKLYPDDDGDFDTILDNYTNTHLSWRAKLVLWYKHRGDDEEQMLADNNRLYRKRYGEYNRDTSDDDDYEAFFQAYIKLHASKRLQRRLKKRGWRGGWKV